MIWLISIYGVSGSSWKAHMNKLDLTVKIICKHVRDIDQEASVH